MTVGSTTVKVKLKNEEKEKDNSSKYTSIYRINTRTSKNNNEIELIQNQKMLC